MIIRNAVLADVPAMVELGYELRNESIFKNADFDRAKCTHLFEQLIAQEFGIVVVAQQEDGEIVGGFVGAVMEHYFGNDRMSFDYAIFIRKDKRGGYTAPRLIDEYKRQAKALGAKIIMLAPSTDINIEKTAELFERMEFRRIGYVMVHQEV
jgi:N-acetylglutamate synthase-like GNAT family acetyltransferase